MSEAPLPVAHSGKVHVKAEKCDTCIFRPGNRMNLRPGRVKEMVDGAIANESGITCHKTIHGQARQEATCAGFYDQYGDRILTFRFSRYLGLIVRVP